MAQNDTAHNDTAHNGAHNDRAHDDLAHNGAHNDRAHDDLAHNGAHNDRAHDDPAHDLGSPGAESTSPGEPGTVIEVHHLRKVYGEKVAVADVSFSVRRGEIFGVLGPNGAGKTTTVEILAGLRQADGGTVRVLGVDPGRDPAAVRARIGVQLQESRLPAKLRVGEALNLYASFYDDPADPAELLDLLGLTEKRDTAYADLSGGQQQRLSIALALVGRPEVAVLDELTTGLDPQARRDTWALVERVRESGVTVVLVTHFMDEAERLCDRLVIIDGGHVVAAGSPAELVAVGEDQRGFWVRLPTGTGSEVVTGLARLPEVESVTPSGEATYEITGDRRVLPATILALAEQDVVPDEIRTHTRSLEDLFVEVTGKKLETVP